MDFSLTSIVCDRNQHGNVFDHEIVPGLMATQDGGNKIVRTNKIDKPPKPSNLQSDDHDRDLGPNYEKL